MTQDFAFLLAIAVLGVFTLRLATRLAPFATEFPVKTFVAAAVSAVVAGSQFFDYQVGEALRIFALIVGPVYVFAPMAVVGLARAGRYSWAAGVVNILYWTSEGRSALRRLIAQAALQKGDAERAVQFIPQGEPLMLAQAYALTGEWEKLLDLELPREGDNSFLGEAARVEALIGLGRLEEATIAVDRMRSRWEAGPKGPLGYRSIRLSEARLAAEQGRFAELRDLLSQPIPGVPAHRLIELLARAAVQSMRYEDAGRLYAQAYSIAPAGLRPRYGERLQELGFEAPEEPAQGVRPVGTYVLSGALVLLYLAQMWLEANVGPFVVSGVRFDSATISAAFLLDMPPALPEAEAWWRYISYSLVHGNLLHIGFNAWVLFDIGRVYEGRRRVENLLAAFVLGTVMGAVITLIAHPGGPLALVGASGGVLGVAGALLADSMTSKTRSDRALRGSLLRWMALIALISVDIPNVSLWGHVGGVVGGLLWGFMRQGLPSSRGVDAFAGAAALALLVVALARAVMVAYRLALI